MTSSTTVTDDLRAAKDDLLRAYLSCTTADRDKIGAIITQLDQLIDTVIE
ncbi:MAG: hypothetical protein SV966_10940 [Actinomycetota bacterium]|nr:hypothetical protein [Actinomycetota bacterium]